ncbi:hypothetical protein P43SY_006467 [Pythium insidiosum]|uniref:Trimethylguanosine synthase n=1 Tax=Pythium insidiosum TaxID=114742 RepID=A0AAD5LAQ2_PYTIN|nr:hypothetical protein P43SY_006467 [Pythium insidiosum]
MPTVTTERWLAVRQGRTVLENPQDARRRQKKRRSGAQHGGRKPSNKKRKTGSGNTEIVEHQNVALFAEAQAQLEEEMAAAGSQSEQQIATEDTEDADETIENQQAPSEGCDSTAVVVAADPPEEAADPAIWKFWKQRRLLFYQYDEGIQLDRESWYSVTPQALAEHLADRCACDVIVDPFSGCGGNIIQFARTCRKVIAIEIDPAKIRMAQHNAAIYGVADRIEWILGDATQILPKLQADVVFLSPPWGGVNYNRTHFRLEEMKIGDVSGIDLFKMARNLTPNIVYYLPKTTPASELEALLPFAGDSRLECEHLYLNGQLKVVNGYFGEMACEDSSTHDAQGIENLETAATTTVSENNTEPHSSDVNK